MSRNIPQITISKVIVFNAAGMPDCEQFEISAVIDTPDEISLLGRIRFEDPSDLVALHNILGNYIRMYNLNLHDEDPAHEEEGGEK